MGACDAVGGSFPHPATKTAIESAVTKGRANDRYAFATRGRVAPEMNACVIIGQAFRSMHPLYKGLYWNSVRGGATLMSAPYTGNENVAGEKRPVG